MEQSKLALTANFDLFGRIVETVPKFDIKRFWKALQD